MLLSSILQILSRGPSQPKTAVKTKIEPFIIEMPPAAAEKPSSSPAEVPVGIAVAGLPMPVISQPATLVPAQSLEDLIRAVTKFEKPEARVVDVFE